MSQLKKWQHLEIPFKEIEIATKNFEACIGKGGYGEVYKGELFISGKLTTVAVKRLNNQYGQGLREFLMEIELLSGQKHPNLISLLGYCEEGKEKIIVYEYAKHGSLDQYLRRSNTPCTLTWLERLKICVDIACGLDHLHNHVGEHQTIIHRDIKSANILIDHNWAAKISDFGLSKLSLAGVNRSAVISGACGTPGYCEPEYISSGIVKKESDVYSFGMVLLEILCGRLCTIIDDDGISLSGPRFKDYYEKKKLDEIIDPSLRQQMGSDSMNKFLAIAYGCLHDDREQRHPMSRVMKELEDSLEIELSSISSDEFQGWSSDSSYSTLVARRNNVGKIFDIFDLNRDGGLSRKELAAFLYVTNFNVEHGEEQISTCVEEGVDEVFWFYDKYIDGKKGLTYHGLLQYYDDGHGDLDSDIVRVVSDSDSDDDDDTASSRRQKLMRIFQKFDSNKDGGLNREEIAAHKSLHEKIGGLPDKVFHWYRKFMDGKRGHTCDGLLKMDDDGASDLDLYFEALGLELKPNNDDEAALWFGSPESLVTTKPLTNRPILLYILITLLLLSITTILVKLSFMWFILVILSNSINAFKNKRKKMH